MFSAVCCRCLPKLGLVHHVSTDTAEIFTDFAIRLNIWIYSAELEGFAQKGQFSWGKWGWTFNFEDTILEGTRLALSIPHSGLYIYIFVGWFNSLLSPLCWVQIVVGFTILSGFGTGLLLLLASFLARSMGFLVREGRQNRLLPFVGH